jgi:hypothetical protein
MSYIWLIGVAIIAIYFVASHNKPKKPPVLPRPTSIQDCGYAGTGGWYDIQNQGVKNDYCRTVGDDPKWTACALAGNNDQLTRVSGNLGDRAELAPGDVCYRGN